MIFDISSASFLFALPDINFKENALNNSANTIVEKRINKKLLVSLFYNTKVKNVLEFKSRDYPTKFILDLILAQPKFLKFLPKLI